MWLFSTLCVMAEDAACECRFGGGGGGNGDDVDDVAADGGKVGLCNQDSHYPIFSCWLCVCEKEREACEACKEFCEADRLLWGRTGHTAVSGLHVEMLTFLRLDLIMDDIQRPYIFPRMQCFDGYKGIIYILPPCLRDLI